LDPQTVSACHSVALLFSAFAHEVQLPFRDELGGVERSRKEELGLDRATTTYQRSDLDRMPIS